MWYNSLTYPVAFPLSHNTLIFHLPLPWYIIGHANKVVCMVVVLPIYKALLSYNPLHPAQQQAY